MTPAEILVNIKKFLFNAAQTGAPASKEYKLQDGTVISMSDFAAGADVLIGGQPAKPGDYVLQDSSKFSIGPDGKVSAVTPVQQAAPTDTPTPVASTLQDGTAVTMTVAAVGGIVTKADGTPLTAGSYTLADGTQITVDATGAITVYTPADNSMNDFIAAVKKGTATHDQLNQVFQKFATSDDPMKILVKALFENVFGWQIQQAATNAAIDVYKTEFATIKGKFDALLQANNSMVEVMETFGATPTGKKPEGETNKLTFYIEPKPNDAKGVPDKYAGAFAQVLNR